MALYVKANGQKFSVQIRGDRVQINRRVRAVGGHRYVLHMSLPIAEFDRLPNADVLGMTPEWFEFASAMAREGASCEGASCEGAMAGEVIA